MRWLKWWRTPDYKTSYAQCGEDLIAAYLLNRLLGIHKPSYLDIGAHHPTNLSNTYYFYATGCTGVCVEPDPLRYADIKQKRPRDICINAGIGGDHREKASFFVFPSTTLSTFSPQVRDSLEAFGNEKVARVLDVELIPVNEIITRYFQGSPNFVSLDTEGMDLDILQGIDFSVHRPEVFCIETLSYTSEEKIPAITAFMHSVDYIIYADTHINTLYVDKKRWDASKTK